MPEDVEKTSDQGPAFQAAQEFQRPRTDSAYFLTDFEIRPDRPETPNPKTVQAFSDRGRLVRLQTSRDDVSFWHPEPILITKGPIVR